MKINTMKKRILLMGAGGRTGVWYSRLLLFHGHELFMQDSNANAVFPDDVFSHPQCHRVDIREAMELVETQAVDGITLSPGVPLSLEIFSTARKKNIPVFSEMEYGWPLFSILGKKSVGITGTDGKSTTTHFTATILEVLGKPSLAAGNFGIPLSEILFHWDKYRQYEVFVFELSSYQLELFRDISMDVGIYLNIAPDHLNRYKSLADYGNTKWNLARSMKSGTFIYSSRLADLKLWEKSPLDEIKNLSLVKVDTDALESEHFSIRMIKNPEELILKGKSNLESISLREIPLGFAGRHNFCNLLFALEGARSLWEGGIPAEKIREALRNLTSLPHRFEILASGDGNTYINDSKATTTQAVMTALENAQGEFFLFMGGKGKGEDYSVLVPRLQEKNPYLFLFGEEREKMATAFRDSGLRIVSMEKSLRDSFFSARDFQKKNHLKKVTYLLSPGATSWDEFKSFEERGDFFKSLVKRS